MKFRPLIVMVSLVLAGCSGSSLKPLDPPAPLSHFAAELEVSPQWVKRLGKGVDRYFVKLPPLLDAGRLYGASLQGDVAAFDARTGNRLWRSTLDRPLYAGPADGGDLLLLGSSDGVIALNKRDGSLAWQIAVGNEVLANPVRAGDIVVVRTVDGKVHAIDVATGNVRWRFSQPTPPLTLRGISTPLIVGDIVVCGFANGKVIALSLMDGTQRWEAVTAVARGRNELERIVDVDAQMVVRGDLLFAASFHGQVVALSMNSGQMVWARDISSWSGGAVASDALYVSDEKGDIWALSLRNGATLWKQTALHGRRLTAPVIQGDYLVVADYDGYLHWMAREDGHLAARIRNEDWDYYWPIPTDEVISDYPEPRAVLATPLVAGDSVYAMDKRGVLGVFQIKPKKP